MNEGQFTPRAALLWTTIPQEARQRILAHVYCVKCKKGVQIANFTGEEQNGDLHLKGSCAKCGYEVVRVVETSETDNSKN
jgi:Zn ribbon nucleic-acid-binding protein